MGRSPCCDKGKVKRGPWSPEEDAVLRSYIDRHGTGGNWIALPHKAGLKRCGKSCRLRWLNYLRPDVKHGGFSDEEDHVICTLYRELGSRWATIASKLPGRTDNEVKNHWNTKLKKRMTAAPVPPLIPTTSPVHLRPSSPAVKTEPYSCCGFSTPPPPPIGPGFSFYHGTSMMGFAEPPDLSGSMNGSFASTPNSASSSVTAESSGVGGGGYAHWPGSGVLGDEAFLSELGFGSLTELLSGYKSAPTIADMWAVAADATAEPQGRYQGLTFS